MPSLERLIELFRQSGRKVTPQRRAILELLAQECTHPTAEDIYQRMAETMPDMSRATVYNTLHELATLGGLSEARKFSDGCLRYDTNTDAHHHLYCIRCHKLIDIHHDFLCVALPPEETAGYQITHHQVTFYGLCPACQESTQ